LDWRVRVRPDQNGRGSSFMITVYEIVSNNQAEVVKQIEKVWGKFKVEVKRDPEDDPNFRYFDRLMREVPRSGGR
jgi:hypothetical protein